MLTKRIAVVFITVLAVALLTLVVGSPSSQGQGGERAPGLEGSWLVTVNHPTRPTFQALTTYAAGGALVVTDGSLPPSQLTSGHGSWVHTRDHTYAFTFVEFLFDPTGVRVGSVRIRETLTLERGGDAYNGNFTNEVLDLDGNVLVSGSGGTTHATRITAE